MQRRLKSKKITNKAFSWGRAVDSPNLGVYPGGGGASVIVGAPLLFDTPLGKRFKESAFYLFYLEEMLCDFIEGGYLKALRLALREYRDFLKRGLCKR